MTPLEIIQAIQTLVVIFLIWRSMRLQSQIDLLDLMLSAIQHEVEALHRRIEPSAAGKEFNRKML